MIGHTISHYRIVEKIGEGGMGVVYKAIDARLGRTVALKFIPSILQSSEDVARFDQEARAISTLNHPHIATLYDLHLAEDKKFLVMEYLPGGTLMARIRELAAAGQRLPLREIIKYGIQIADGLTHAHHHGIVHRDIKCDNMMLTAEGSLKIADFGLAKLRESVDLTRPGSAVGTLAYMAPEQLRGEEIDRRVDLFSLGVILYEMTAGQRPFRGEHAAALTYSIANEEPVPLKSLRPDTPEALETIIMKCLQKDKSERYQTAEDVSLDLRSLPEEPAGVKEIKHRGRNPKKTWLLLSASLLATFVILLVLVPSLMHRKSADEVKSIAVLPFIDVSINKDQQYFSDGLSEELLNVLAKNPGLRVTSRTSAFSFRGKEVDIKTIAARLNVDHILEGSVRKSADTLRITAHLIDVRTDATLWSEVFDGSIGNIFSVQKRIAQAVSAALNVTLLGKEGTTAERETSPEAYNAYLLGGHFFDLRGKENFEKAIEYYGQALAIDSNYAAAWEGLSRVHASQADIGFIPTEEGYGKARQELKRSLDLESTRASSYALLAWIQRNYDWDWEASERSYKRALELESGNATVLSGASTLASTLGRFEEASELLLRAIERDPIRSASYYNLGFVKYYAGRLDESERATRQCLLLNPQYPAAHLVIGLMYLEKGRPDSALAAISQESEPGWRLFGLALAYHAMGKKESADSAASEFMNEYEAESAFQVAEIYAYRGEKDQAFEWLERAYRRRDSGLVEMIGDPLLRGLQNDPRYKPFMRRMKFSL